MTGTTILTTTRHGWVAQQYRPDHLEADRYYEPSTNGFEADIARRMAAHDTGPEARPRPTEP